MSKRVRLRVLSLFSGIGGLDLGLERAGMRIVAHSEIDPYACRVLKKHWPGVPNLGDITQVEWGESLALGGVIAWDRCEPDDSRLRQWNLGRVDVIAGGFPCNDTSRAGRRAGVENGVKSGLFSEVVRAVRAIRPNYVILENSATLTTRGLDTVLGELAASGYDAEWECIPAAALGAPHIRDRCFIVAYPGSGRYGAPKEAVFARRQGIESGSWWTDEPAVPRVDADASNGVDRRRVIGMSVAVPVAEYIGTQIMKHAETHLLQETHNA